MFDFFSNNEQQEFLPSDPLEGTSKNEVEESLNLTKQNQNHPTVGRKRPKILNSTTKKQIARSKSHSSDSSDSEVSSVPQKLHRKIVGM